MLDHLSPADDLWAYWYILKYVHLSSQMQIIKAVVVYKEASGQGHFIIKLQSALDSTTGSRYQLLGQAIS